METLVYILGFVIGVLGTSFLLYYLKTRKLLKQQHELIMLTALTLLGKAPKCKEKSDKVDDRKEDVNSNKEKK